MSYLSIEEFQLASQALFIRPAMEMYKQLRSGCDLIILIITSSMLSKTPQFNHKSPGAIDLLCNVHV